VSWQLTLEHRDDEEGLFRRTLSLRDDDSLVLDGHDLGRGVSRIFGYSEYEFARTIPPDQMPKLRQALGLAADADIRAVLAEQFARRGGSRDFEQLLKDQGVGSEFWSRIGD
jgi:hypothetical protein